MRVLCQAMVEKPLNGSNGWQVLVYQMPDYTPERSYVITATCEHDAAMEGMRRFVEEMEAESGRSDPGQEP